MTDVGLGSWPARRARIAPDAVAFRQGTRSVTYAESAARVDGLARRLAAYGVAHGDRVAYLGANDIATFETLFAAGRLGAVFVPLNIRLAAAELAYMLGDSGARVLVHGPAYAEAADAAVAAMDGDVEGDPPPLLAPDPYGDLPVARGPRPSLAEVSFDDDALVLYTSGTTGHPKGAVLTHGNLTFNTVNQLAQTDVLSSDTVLCTAPLFHVAGLGQVTLPTLFKGGTLCVAPTFDPAGMLDAIGTLRINAFPAVPTMLQLLCDHPDFAAADLGSLRYVVYGGSPVLARVAEAWLARGVDLMQGYGMTETSPGVLLATAEGARSRQVSAGVPQFYVDVALAGAGDGSGEGEETGNGDGTDPPGTGELLVRGPNVSRGYLGRPEESARAHAGGWFHTGDVVRIDRDGWGHVVGRIKDVIISGGENVYPAEVEAAIAGLDGVAECAVVGVPDGGWGEVGHAVVVPREGRGVDADSVRTRLDGRIARYKIPKYVETADSLPRNAAGKVLKAELRRELRRRAEDFADTDPDPGPDHTG